MIQKRNDWDTYPYMTYEEMDMLAYLLDKSIDDTFGCWKRTRINGISASLACDGNTSIPILRKFDEIFKLCAERQKV